MIGYLRGKVFENVEGRLLIEVGAVDSLSAVGYSVTIPQSPTYLSLRVGHSVELFIYSHVREDAFELYGFLSRAEKELFLTLLTVKGIGPKGATGILSKVEPAQLIQAVVNRDQDSLTRIPGIGKKTAERVVVELADPLAKKWEAGVFGSQSARMGGAVSAGAPILMRDARDALLGLGYREHQITPLLNRILEENSSSKVEDIIRIALQKMSPGV